MTEICQVKKVKRRVAYIEIKRKDECNGCNICSFNKRKSMTVPALCELEVQVGDSVEVQMPEQAVGSGSLLIYAVPILLMLVGALIGLVGGVWLQVGLCAGGLALGFAAAFLIDRAYRKKPGVMPRVVKIATEQEVDATENIVTTEKTETTTKTAGTDETVADDNDIGEQQ